MMAKNKLPVIYHKEIGTGVLKPAAQNEEQEKEFNSATILQEIANFKQSKLAPIKAEIQRLQGERRQIDIKLNDLNQLEAELEGRAVVAKNGGVKTRRRLSEQDKLALGRVLFDKLKASRLNKFSSADLEGFCDGFPPREIIALWNEKAENKGEKIHVEGTRRACKYFVA
jgi:hypothetical protein